MSVLNQDSKIKLPDVDMTQVAGKATEVAGKAGKAAGQAAGKAAEVVKGIDFAQILKNIGNVIMNVIGAVFMFFRYIFKRLGFWGTIEFICAILALIGLYFILIAKDYNMGLPFAFVGIAPFVYITNRKKNQ